MPRSLIRISLAFLLLLSSELWALGLGDIRIESALNEPLRADIELLSASPEELTNLSVVLASAETFARYGIDRPFYLQNITFEVVRTGRVSGNLIRVQSATPMTEPFLTFLVEVTWSRGRLLREYTVFLDPPTFRPPAATQPAPQVSAPQRSTQGDSGRIEREPVQQQRAPAPASRPQPAPSPTPTPAPTPTQPPKPAPVADNTPYDSTAGGDYVVRRGETLWGIAAAIRPDSRLTMNQTMLAIYQANPQAFGGNINLLREGARIRVPSADEIYRIDRGSAFSEVKRQNTTWDGSPGPSTSAPSVTDTDSRPSLTLVPPDDEPVGLGTGTDDADATVAPVSREQEILDRIAAIEATDVPMQRSLIEIRNNELAALRQELANIRGTVYEPDDTATDDPFVVDDTDDVVADDDDAAIDDIMVDDDADAAATDPADDTATDAADADAAVADPTTRISSRRAPQPSLLDKAKGWLTSIWAIIGGALLLAGGVLLWFMRRGGGDDEPEAWGSAALDADDDPYTGTETLRAPVREDESFVVVEQDGEQRGASDTVEIPQVDDTVESETFGSLEDTFSSDTAINLDQSDPIAEADFHMAYGLYDQAADLINGALEVEPERQDLLTKLCEIYFVWGNRDAFIDAAERLQGVTGGDSGDWDKIVIMGQQIASDHALFAGAGVAGATREVDLSFESDGGDDGALDMDFGTSSDEGDVIDLGGGDDDDGVDFLFDDSDVDAVADLADADVGSTSEMPTVEQPGVEPTVEMPKADSTVETPTIEEQFAGFDDGTAELPSIGDAVDALAETGSHAPDATAEINLDDLGLNLDGLDDDISSYVDDDATEFASMDDLDSTGTNEALDDLSDSTGKNPQVDPNTTGVQETLRPDAGVMLDDEDVRDELSETAEMKLARDETGLNPALDPMEATDTSIDQSLLDATGRTQVLSGDMAVDTYVPDENLGDDDATMMAPMDDGESDFDFAKTEALPPDAYGGDIDPESTGELPAIGGTDVDLDLDDLTAALKISDLGEGDTVEQFRDDATVEQPRPGVPGSDSAETQELSPDDLSDGLHEARTMTEVGTKLDLARAYVDMGDPAGARSILEEVLDEGDEGQRQQAQQLLDSLPS